MSELKDWLKAWRKDHKTTQKATADLLGMPMRTYQHIEAGDRESPEWVKDLIKYRLKNEKKRAAE